MKRPIIRLVTLTGALPAFETVLAHPHHPETAGIAHQLAGVEYLAALLLPVVMALLVAGCRRVLARRR